ncbi:MAG: ATP-binding protein [Kangiellaceae bacterium]|nr:ATP-binding protein [Kangiellaceae bacterium]
MLNSIKNSSLKQRLTLVSTIILLIAFSIIFFATRSAYVIGSKARLQENMTAQVYALMAIANDDQGQLFIPDVLRNERLENLSSGLVAYVLDSDGTLIWQSPSSELFETLPDTSMLFSMQEISKSTFEGREMYWVGDSIIWEHSDLKTNEKLEKSYYFIVGEKRSILKTAIENFTDEIFAWLSISGVLLLVVFTYSLSILLKPLKDAQHQIELVRMGKAKLVEGSFPEELMPLTSSINQLLDSEARQKNRFRDSLGNLAHSLKTPLAILKSEIESNPVYDKDDVLKDQVDRIDDIVKYQLNRSVVSAGRTLVKTCAVEPEVIKIVGALRKVHQSKNISVDYRIAEGTIFPGDAGDLLELVGNLSENACKWTNSRVVISAKHKDGSFCLYVDDDGPGIEKPNRAAILNRGKRLDQSTEGQGLGLSIVMDIINNYRGAMSIETSSLGGALFKINMPIEG